MTTATCTCAARSTLAIGTAALACALAAAAPACTPDADLGFWMDDRNAPLASAGDGAGAAGSPGVAAGETGSSAGVMSQPDAAVAPPDAASAGVDAGEVPPPADAGEDGATEGDGGGACELDGGATLPDEITIGVAATVYFAGGAVLPGGRYRVSYVDGCRKFNSVGSGWTVNGTAPTLTRATVYTILADDVPSMMAPGTLGLFPGPGTDPYGAFDTYDECVAANRNLQPVDLDFAGGTLGIVDGGDGTPADDVTGESEGGRNPTFELARVDPCP